MDKLVSSWYNVRSVPEDYIFPPETRPGNLHVPIGEVIPVIDLSEAERGDRTATIQKILKAAQEFGFFRVINHGVSQNLMNEAMSVFKEPFQWSNEAKQNLYSEDVSKHCRLKTCSIYCTTDKVHLWRDFLMHPCHPLEKWQHTWPLNPTRYQECVGACSVEVKKLASRILAFICERPGLKCGYFDDELSGSMMLSVNHYPPCPQPSLTLGSSKHADLNLITILLQDDVYGLQVLKEDKWIGVEPNPHAFVVNMGCLLQVISNNKLKSAEHRVVTNPNTARTSAAFFVLSLEDSIIEPAKDLTDVLHPPIYKPFKIKDFLTQFLAKNGDLWNKCAKYSLLFLALSTCKLKVVMTMNPNAVKLKL
ncbi:hyoscyamine 6-dioxygenase-like [Prosopis cineraria]|uniref:hyoscyamine 6-dioxygenase-like n=1 Tax=Prosopis cineraria TaxID=364024 RepID=UPI00240EEB8F|nr:hyoscyamine 6-dioxygenase-like [Prosopis cineraria]